MMKIEFLYSEVLNFLKLNSLFKLSLTDRVQTLVENGDIDDECTDEAIKQKYNEVILDNFHYSKLIKNSFLENKIKEITGNNIVILDHKNEFISGIPCIACDYIVFESREDSFYEICPVCGWQNDGKIADEYSSSNHSTLNQYTSSDNFKSNVLLGDEIYIKKDRKQ